jgi:hypothetical protein
MAASSSSISRAKGLNSTWIADIGWTACARRMSVDKFNGRNRQANLLLAFCSAFGETEVFDFSFSVKSVNEVEKHSVTVGFT